jgi:dihydrofolate synthase / folylpolyglutamate synthase
MAGPELIHLARLHSRGHWGIKRGLENPRLLLEGLHRPDQDYPVVLIAGTNGKGSTGAFLANALRASGLRVGWTTSPHLVSPAERIWVDGACSTPAALDALLAEVFAVEASTGIQATYFELMIASAVLAFRRQRVDIALVEVGLGGRWDATNVLDPILTVLTNVALDHTKYLGNTLESIAREKLCTARSGRPLVLGPELDPVWITPLLEVQPVLFPSTASAQVTLFWDHSLVKGHRVGLGGAHQIRNLATALEVLERLRLMGFKLPEEAQWEGIARTCWPGRLWAFPGLENVWADGAHNPDGARVLAGHATQCGVRPHVYFSAMSDKDIPAMARMLETMAPAGVTLVKGQDERYASPEALQNAWGLKHRVLALEEAAEQLREGHDVPRLVTGSLFFIGDLLRVMGIRPWP